jgi:hypothetical protein
MWFQQDTGTAHEKGNSLEALEDMFDYRIICCALWPAQ